MSLKDNCFNICKSVQTTKKFKCISRISFIKCSRFTTCIISPYVLVAARLGVERNQTQENGSFQELPELVPAAFYTKVQLVLFLNSLFVSKSISLNQEDLLSFQDILYYLKYEYRKKDSIIPLGNIIIVNWIIDFLMMKSLTRKKKLD